MIQVSVAPAAVLCALPTLCCSGVTLDLAVPCSLFTPCFLRLQLSSEFAHPLKGSVWRLQWGHLGDTDLQAGADWRCLCLCVHCGACGRDIWQGLSGRGQSWQLLEGFGMNLGGVGRKKVLPSLTVSCMLQAFPRRVGRIPPSSHFAKAMQPAGTCRLPQSSSLLLSAYTAIFNSYNPQKQKEGT